MSSRIYLSFDPGSSLTKAIVQVGDQHRLRKRQYLLLSEPHTVSVPLSTIRQHPSTNADTPVIEKMWLQLKDHQESGSAIAVGFLAQQLLVRERHHALKYESALYKILALIGAITQHHGLDTDSPIALHLNVLLPYGEYGNREHLQALIRHHLQQFNFCGISIQARLEKWSCVPESYGLIKLAQTQTPIRGKTVTLMFGHRNTSCIVQERGVLNVHESMTTDLGFHQLVKRICERTSIKQQHRLAGTLYQLEVMDKAIAPNEPLIRKLCPSREAKNQATESRVIARTIQDCIEEYWFLIKDWLSAELPLDADHYIIGGGASKHLETRLKQFFDGNDQYWCEAHIPALQRTLRLHTSGFDPINMEAMSVRVIDVYGLHQKKKSPTQKQQLCYST